MIADNICKLVPWILPAILFCSWVYNWKGSPTGGKGKSKKSDETKTDPPAETPSDSE